MADETITLDNLPSWAAAKARALAGASFVPLIKIFRLLIIGDVRQAFAKEADPVTGAAWARFAPSTLKKKKRGTSPKLLRDTGILAASVSAAGGAGNIDEVTATSLRFGSALPRAAWHNEGTRRIPQRRFIGVGPSLVARMEQATAEFAAGLIGGKP